MDKTDRIPGNVQEATLFFLKFNWVNNGFLRGKGKAACTLSQ